MPLKILMVEDSPRDTELIVRQLRRIDSDLTYERVDSARQMAAALTSQEWDLVISDYNLPQMCAPDALSILKASGRDIPFIVVSGRMGEDTAVAMMKAGAHDYLMKDNLTRLGPAVLRELREAKIRNERKLADARLRASLEEKEFLLKEIHHRVKNNLQVIASMLRMQAERADDERLLAHFQAAQSRIHSMALVHEKLYRSSDFADINFAEYLRDVTAELFRLYSKDGVFLETDIQDIRMSVDLAIPCGLIVNELVSNSLKHAFPDGRRGVITIAMRVDGPDSYLLTVEDTGIGMTATFDPLRGKTLGLNLVSLLVQQIDGTVKIESRNGTRYAIGFKYPA